MSQTKITSQVMPIAASALLYAAMPIPAGAADQAIVPDGKQQIAPAPSQALKLKNKTAAIGASTGVAGSGAAAGSSGAGTTGGSEQIVVTAQKRSQTQITTPVSVSVVTSQAIQRLAATQFSDYATTVPGLNFATSGVGNSTINIRGVTTGVDIDPTVGIYVNDVPYGSSSAYAGGASFALDAGLFDLSRVEVLRGPQGTLYGASTMGGLIKYVTTPPNTYTTSGAINSGVSTTEGGGIGFNGNTVFNIPLVKDKLAVRISDYYVRDAGYVNNVGLDRNGVNQSNVYGTRGDVLYTPTDNLDVRFEVFGQNIDRNGSNYVDRNLTTEQPVEGVLDQYRLAPEDFNQQFRIYSGTVTYRTPLVDITSISSWQTITTHEGSDFSANYVPLLTGLGYKVGAVGGVADVTTDKFTQEIRLASPGHHPLEWLVGGFLTHENSNDGEFYTGQAQPLGPTVLTLLQGPEASTYREYAAFGDLTYHITNKLDITGGLRFADNEQTFGQNFSGVLGSPPSRGESHGNDLTYLANVRYLFNPTTMAYVRFSSGYRPGGPNLVVPDPVTGKDLTPASFASDTLNSYEVGFKSDFAHHLVTVDTDFYYINWQDIQVEAVTNGFSNIANAGAATIKGGEESVTVRPVRGLSLVANLSLNEGQLDQDELSLGAMKGAQLPNSPRFTTSFLADYKFPVGKSNANIGTVLRYVSPRVSGFNEQPGEPQYFLGDYETVDFHGELYFGKWTAQLYLHNAFNSHGQLAASTLTATAGGPAEVALLQPRTVGFNLGTSF